MAQRSRRGVRRGVSSQFDGGEGGTIMVAVSPNRNQLRRISELIDPDILTADVFQLFIKSCDACLLAPSLHKAGCVSHKPIHPGQHVTVVSYVRGTASVRVPPRVQVCGKRSLDRNWTVSHTECGSTAGTDWAPPARQSCCNEPPTNQARRSRRRGRDGEDDQLLRIAGRRRHISEVFRRAPKHHSSSLFG